MHTQAVTWRGVFVILLLAALYVAAGTLEHDTICNTAGVVCS